MVENSKPKVMSLAAALTALTGVGLLISAPGEANTPSRDEVNTQALKPASTSAGNLMVKAGADLLGFTVTRAPDGTIVTADHESHASHSSHSSHASHQSGF